MLPKDDGGVVDQSLKVRVTGFIARWTVDNLVYTFRRSMGSTNIRVADLSIVPLHIGGHPVGAPLHSSHK